MEEEKKKEIIIPSFLPPKIKHIEWGKMEVIHPQSGEMFVYKDCKIYPHGSQIWDWNKTGTRHSPGIQWADVEDMISIKKELENIIEGEDCCLTSLILSRGMRCKLKTMDETYEKAKEKGMTVHILQTEEAVEKYNQLITDPKERVAGLFHSTC